MSRSSQEWYEDMARRTAELGHRDQDPSGWRSWPWDEGYVVRALEGPVEETPRSGAGGVDCFICSANDDPGDYVIWWDDLFMLGRKIDGSPLPFMGFLMPRRHADLGDLTHEESARMGVLLTNIERAVTEVLDVPLMHVSRWGDGSEHLHWWLYGRPRGVLQLRGTFLAMWEDLLPVRDPDDEKIDLNLVTVRLGELVGGEVRPLV